jgi:tRNA dimethylallyltransferase
VTRWRVAALVGPTAVGKTAVAVDVALRIGAEIVSIDSMQAYAGMDVGTAKPSGAARRRAPHHLVGAWDPRHELTVAEFRQRAREAIDDIARRERIPLLVGGSGLYFRAVVDDLEFPPRSPELRARLEAEARAEGGAGRLHARLARLDPDAAARIAPANTRRVVRALEIREVTGTATVDYGPWRSFESVYDLSVAGLERPRDELYARIERRAEAMVASGLRAEAARLEAEGVGSTARQALGYRQALEDGDASDEALAGAIARATKRFARRQEGWFRRDPRVVWFPANAPDVVERLGDFFGRGSRSAAG